jgi:hypothetical protein
MSAPCAWPIGDPRDPSYRTCGHPVAPPGLPYCAQHTARAYRKESVRPRLRHSAGAGLAGSEHPIPGMLKSEPEHADTEPEGGALLKVERQPR